MEIQWIRGNEKISFSRPNTFFVIGTRGEGKSTFLETLGGYYLEKGHAILDLFGSRDGEGLSWLRSPYAEDKRFLLVHGESVDVSAPCDTKAATKLKLKDFDDYDIIISASPLYLSPDDEFINAAQLTDRIYKRLSWKRYVYGIVREAANLYYSRLKVSENQIFAKSQMVYLIREARHVGLALGLDSVRYYAIDIDIRNLSDYIILKSQGMFGLTSDLNWLYSIFEPYIIRNMPAKYFLVVSRRGAIGVGQFKEIPWHKKERENILEAVGIKCEYGEPVEAGEYRGTFKTVGDKEHAEIIKLYVEEALSLGKIAEKLVRSSRTPHKHINKHNRSVEASGFCPSCRRVKSPFENKIAQRSTSSAT